MTRAQGMWPFTCPMLNRTATTHAHSISVVLLIINMLYIMRHRTSLCTSRSSAIHAFQLVDTVTQQIRRLMRQLPSGETEALLQDKQQA